jgi:ABC-type transporter Mla subunit MlaD
MAYKSLISYIYGIHAAVNSLGGNPTETAPATDTASSGLNGRAQRIAQRITSLLTLTGDVVETAPATDTASSGLNGRAQRIAQRLTSLIGLTGDVVEAAPATDTASSGLNGRAQRIAQRLTSLIGLTGDVVEAAPASDTASSGLNGRAQRIAQNITSLIAIATTTRDHLSTIKDTLSGTVANTYNNIIIAKTGTETTADIQLTKTAYAITALGLAGAETVVLQVKDPVTNAYFTYLTLTAAAPVANIVNLPVTAQIIKSATAASVGVVLSYH